MNNPHGTTCITEPPRLDCAADETWFLSWRVWPWQDVFNNGPTCESITSGLLYSVEHGTFCYASGRPASMRSWERCAILRPFRACKPAHE